MLHKGIDNYANYIAKDRGWAGVPEMMAISELYNIDIGVFRIWKEGGSYYVTHPSSAGIASDDNSGVYRGKIHLAWTGTGEETDSGNHYEPLIPRDETNMTPPVLYGGYYKGRTRRQTQHEKQEQKKQKRQDEHQEQEPPDHQEQQRSKREHKGK